MLLNPLLEWNPLFSVSCDFNPAIELLKDSKEHGEVVCIIELCVQILVLVEDLNEVAHKVRENGDSEHENE